METTIPDTYRQSLASLSVAYPSAITIFNQYDLDYCCGGNISLAEACAAKHLNPEKIMNEIQMATNAEPSFLHPESWSAALLIDFIEQNYHTSTRSSIVTLRYLLDKVCAAHSAEHPEVEIIKKEFDALADELIDHMKKEELVLFPALRERAYASATHEIFLSDLHQPIAAMEHEHQHAGDHLKRIRNLSHHYTPPADACPTYLLTYQKLEAFDRELIQHIHLENNILFKRA